MSMYEWNENVFFCSLLLLLCCKCVCHILFLRGWAKNNDNDNARTSVLASVLCRLLIIAEQWSTIKLEEVYRRKMERKKEENLSYKIFAYNTFFFLC